MDYRRTALRHRRWNCLDISEWEECAERSRPRSAADGPLGALERRLDTFDERVAVERLAQKADGAGIERLPLELRVRKRSDEDDRRPVVLSCEAVLHVET